MILANETLRKCSDSKEIEKRMSQEPVGLMLAFFEAT